MLMVRLLQKEVEDVKSRQFSKICRDINRASTTMNTLDENVWDSLEQVHLHVDALLQHTTMSPAADVQATPPSDSAPAQQHAQLLLWHLVRFGLRIQFWLRIQLRLLT
jgi:hypothetical protein